LTDVPQSYLQVLHVEALSSSPAFRAVLVGFMQFPQISYVSTLIPKAVSLNKEDQSSSQQKAELDKTLSWLSFDPELV
jgi:hypothetical protein